jgi:hypothetical protein
MRREETLDKKDVYANLASVLAGQSIDSKLEAEVALEWCFGITSVSLSFMDKTVLDEARDAWFALFGPRFIKAIEVNHRHLIEDIGHLSVKSVSLAQHAALHAGAGNVTKDAALKAANDIECEAVTRFPQLHWCAP